MTSEARKALRFIRECIDSEHYALTFHFSKRMEDRGLFWLDIQAIIEEPAAVESQGLDTCYRPKWIIRGEAATGEEIAIVCAIEIDERGTEFITIFWED